MPRCNIKTMTDMKKTVTVKKRQVAINGNVMYFCLMSVKARKKMSLTRVMSLENEPVPHSLFGDDGALHSSKKSDFMHRIEELLPERTTKVDYCNAVIFDGHTVIHLLEPPERKSMIYTFGDMA